jgi:uncharacterized membrane protein
MGARAMKLALPRTKAAKTVAVILAVYTGFFFWLACRKFDLCTYQSGDIANVNWFFYTALHGKFFWHPYLQGPEFEMHQEPLIMLFWPMYALVPGPKTLILLQTLSISIAGLAVYLIGLRVLKEAPAAILGMLAFLFYPSIVSQHVNQLHTSIFPLPFLMLAFYFFVAERFWPFVLCAALACLGKENTAFTVAMFLPYAAVSKRRWQWIVTPGVLAVASLLLSFKVIQPYFAQGRAYIALETLAPFGKSVWSVIGNMFSSPAVVLQSISNGKTLLFLVSLLQPLGFLLPLCAPEAVLALPDGFINTISTNDGMRVLAWHYDVNIGAFLCVATICALPRWERLVPGIFSGPRVRSVVMAVVFVLCLSNWWQWFNWHEFVALPEQSARERAFELIPKNASCLVGPGQLVGHLSQRDVFTTSERFVEMPEEMFKFNWVIFDMNYTLWMPNGPSDLQVSRDTFASFATNSMYALVFREDNVFVFERREPLPPSTIVLKRRTRFY